LFNECCRVRLGSLTSKKDAACYTGDVGEPVGKIDKPEPRWQALLALLAVGGVYVALPRAFIVGPKWVLPVFIAVLIAPTVVAHRTGRQSLNRVLGIIVSSAITLALIASVALLVAAVPAHKEEPIALLASGAELWFTNVLVFALWYWRLDGGGPTARGQRREFGSRSFIFPQMQIEKIERGRFECQGWQPHFVDYLFIAWTTSSTFGPTDAPLLARWAKVLTMVQIGISLTIVIVLISRAVGVL
jgi:hypothetical protein